MRNARQYQVAGMLAANPDLRSRDVTERLGMTYSQAIKIMHSVADAQKPKNPADGIRWTLREVWRARLKQQPEARPDQTALLSPDPTHWDTDGFGRIRYTGPIRTPDTRFDLSVIDADDFEEAA